MRNKLHTSTSLSVTIDLFFITLLELFIVKNDMWKQKTSTSEIDGCVRETNNPALRFQRLLLLDIVLKSHEPEHCSI